MYEFDSRYKACRRFSHVESQQRSRGGRIVQDITALANELLAFTTGRAIKKEKQIFFFNGLTPGSSATMLG